MKRVLRNLLAISLPLPWLVSAQTLDIQDSVRTYPGLTNTVITLSGRAELRVTGPGDPLPGCVIHLNSPDSWLLLTDVLPSQVSSALLSRFRVNGAPAALDSNLRVVQFAEGAVVIPQGSSFSPLEVFDGRYFTGSSKRMFSYVEYNNSLLGSMAGAIRSFKLKRGYMATFAHQENGSGISRCYVAQDGDLEVGRLLSSFETNIHFVRVFPWRWATKKGVAGNIESGLNVGWLYNWNLDRSSPLNWEYVPIRQTRWWPSLDQDWQARGASHVLGYNEPDRPDQANLAVGDAIWSWPDLLAPGLRVGAPAVSDGGLSWLYDFMSQADAADLRVDFVPVHYYRCYGNAGDPNGAATQFYNFLKGIYDVVKRPLWITEWNNGANWTGCADPSFAQQAATVSAILDMLDNTPFVERYAIYNWVEDVRRIKWDDGSLTAAGTNYRNNSAPLAYRQELPDSGIGSSARFCFDGDTHDGGNNGLDAMRIGAPSFTAGKYGQAILLNGSTDYLQLSPRVGDSSDWSFAAWVYWHGGGSWQRVFDLGADTGHYLFLSPRTSGGSLRFAINNGGGEQQLSAPALATGVWTHVAVTIAGNTGKLFINGAAVATNTSMSINPSDVGTQFNYLGKSRFSADPLFSGRLDDVRFISSALSDAEVATIVNSPPPQFRTRSVYKPDALPQQPYSSSLAGEATGSGPLTFTKMDGPSWLSVAANGSLAGTPASTNGGLNNFLVRVTDTNGSFHTARLLIAVPTFNGSVASAADDAEQSAAGVVTLNSTDLELVNDDATSSGNQTIGLRFTDLSIPPGAVIHSATIQFTADESQSESTSLNLTVEAADDAPAFTTAANNLGARARISLNVPWQPGAWTVGQSTPTQSTPNLAGLVQEVITRPGWRAGNSIVFLISGVGHRTADAFDKSGGSPPRLNVSYTSPTPLQVVESTINSSPNDAEQAASGTVNLDSTDLELVNDSAAGSADQLIGLRFENIVLPPGAVIESAYIQFSADETQNEPTTLLIRAQAADHAPIFTTNANNLSSRALTIASASWSPPAWATIAERGPLQRTPDLSFLVQEVVKRPGWTSGNAIAFIISGTGHRTAVAADGLGGLPASLIVRYWSELPAATFPRWAQAHPGASSMTADPDGDGYKNLLEFALGLDPAIPEHGATQASVDNTAVYLTYTRPSAVTDVTYQVEWAGTVNSPVWASSGILQHIISDNGSQRTIRATIPKTPATQRFIRLKVAR